MRHENKGLREQVAIEGEETPPLPPGSDSRAEALCPQAGPNLVPVPAIALAKNTRSYYVRRNTVLLTRALRPRGRAASGR